MPNPPRRPFRPKKGRNPSPAPSPRAGKKQERGWDPVATWYDKLVGESGSDYHQNVILPAALRLLNPQADESIIDVCCGQGVLAKPLLETKIKRFVGIDASPRLIEAAQNRYNDNRASFLVADACKPGAWADGSHDAATCLMAVHDVPDAAAMFSAIRKALKPQGRALFVFMHPCFRIPQHTHWGWDGDQKVQFRRIDNYKSAVDIEITTHPGKESKDTQTIFYHRSLGEVITALGNAKLAVTECEELYSHRRSQGTGPFSKAEHRAAEEIPLFIAIGTTAL